MPAIQSLWFEDQEIRYRRSANASSRQPPVVFIGGAFQNIGSWKHFESAFRDRTETVAVELPGSGETRCLPSSRGLDFVVDALARLLGKLDLPPCFLVSASYGTPVAYQLCQRYPQLVDRVCLAGVMKQLPDHKREAILRTIEYAERGDRAAVAHEVVNGLLCQEPDRPIARRKLANRILKSNILRMDDDALLRYATNTRRLLESPDLDTDVPPEQPGLVFTGEFDVFTTPRHCKQIADAMPRSQYALIPEADHLFHIEQFEKTLQLLIDFGEAQNELT